MIIGKRGDFNILGMVVGMLTAFLFTALITIFIIGMGGEYDISGFEEDDLIKYNQMDNLSEDINQVYGDVDQITIDKTVFDYFADIYSKIVSPFKFIYRTFTTLTSLINDVVSDLRLYPVVGDYFAAVLIVLVIVGIVMIKFYMNRQK